MLVRVESAQQTSEGLCDAAVCTVAVHYLPLNH